ncbi:unnamed protein product [Acanthoscelides obtectus]|uniref:Uncharacterized protein n=1 Tax=Acanthoscelides obtectus TaxID=200917 RepID=A0A9P0VT59_ACAOB|nr:unnamed protein product [Acanthoscelides obtectus]CAK1687627.1 hypothetical protein AOBTE_LOCUS36302 [Acanthoscelides obtectus]
MSQIFTLKSHTSTLSIDFVNPIRLEDGSDYGLSLLSFYSYNSVPNIDEGHNKFYYYENNNKNREKNIVIPTGAYEIEDIESYIKKHIVDGGGGGGEGGDRVKDVFSLKPNLNTLKCELYSSVHGINFQPKDSIAYVLGYSPSRVLEPRIYHQSDLPVNIVKVRTIHIDSNITVGAFYNDRPSHTIYEFSITDEAGCAINESPKNLIYLPVNQREINNITLMVLDQNFELVHFRGEEIIIRLELKKL